MLTIKRNNPHKKISVGLFSIAVGFVSTYGLLSAMGPDTETVGTKNPRKPIAIVSQKASLASAKQDDASDAQHYRAEEPLDNDTSYPQPITYTEPSVDTLVPATSSDHSNTVVTPTDATPDEPVTGDMPDAPIPEEPGVLETVTEITETLVTTVLPIR